MLPVISAGEGLPRARGVAQKEPRVEDRLVAPTV